MLGEITGEGCCLILELGAQIVMRLLALLPQLSRRLLEHAGQRLQFRGQASDIMLHAQEILSLKRRLNEIYQVHTGRALDEIEAALERDNFMTAALAKEFGLIDSVITSRSTLEAGA